MYNGTIYLEAISFQYERFREKNVLSSVVDIVHRQKYSKNPPKHLLKNAPVLPQSGRGLLSQYPRMICLDTLQTNISVISAQFINIAVKI